MEKYYRHTHRLSPFLFFYFLIFSFSSCQEGHEAGDLWGQWRLADSGAKYVSFSGSVALLKDLDISGLGVYGNFQHRGDSLFVQCYSSQEERSDTAVVEESFGFRPFRDIRLRVESLSGDRLVLSSGSRSWTFYSY